MPAARTLSNACNCSNLAPRLVRRWGPGPRSRAALAQLSPNADSSAAPRITVPLPSSFRYGAAHMRTNRHFLCLPRARRFGVSPVFLLQGVSGEIWWHAMCAPITCGPHTRNRMQLMVGLSLVGIWPDFDRIRPNLASTGRCLTNRSQIWQNSVKITPNFDQIRPALLESDQFRRIVRSVLTGFGRIWPESGRIRHKPGQCASNTARIGKTSGKWAKLANFRRIRPRSGQMSPKSRPNRSKSGAQLGQTRASFGRSRANLDRSAAGL